MRCFHSSVPSTSVIHVSCNAIYDPEFQVDNGRLFRRIAREFVKNQQIRRELEPHVEIFLATPERKLIRPEILGSLEWSLTPNEMGMLADLRRWLLRVSVRRSQRGTPTFVFANLNTGLTTVVIALP